MLGAKPPIRIGVVGCGRILPAHLRGYALLRLAGIDTFRITGLVSRNPDDAAMFRRRGEGPPPRPPVSQNPNDPLAAPHRYVSDFQPEVDAAVFPDLDTMLAADAVDALLILTPVYLHHPQALAGLRVGKHCLLDKPLAISVRTARELVDTAKTAGLTLGVTETVRYTTPTRLARWLIDHSYLGDLQMATWWSVGTPEWSPDKIVADTPWRHEKLRAGGGASVDIGVHWFHRLRYLLGEPIEISGLTRTFEPKRYRRQAGDVIAEVICDVDDAFFAQATFPGGAIAQISFTWAGHGEPTNHPHGLTLYGSRGSLKGDLLTLSDGSQHSARALFDQHADPADRARYFPHGLTDPFALSALDFLNGIAAGRDPETSGAEGLRDLAASFAVCESSQLGRPVALNDVLSSRVDSYQRDIDQHHRPAAPPAS